MRDLKKSRVWFFYMAAMVNVGGTASPLPDAKTEYVAKTAGRGFLEVVQNSGLVVIIASTVTTLSVG